MSFFAPAALADLGAAVRSAMSETVSFVSPGVATRGAYGEAVVGLSVTVERVRAQVSPESADERIAADRPAHVAGYTVRVPLADLWGAVPSAAWTVLWERDAASGGTVEMAVAGVVNIRGRFLDFLCTAESAGASAAVPA